MWLTVICINSTSYHWADCRGSWRPLVRLSDPIQHTCHVPILSLNPVVTPTSSVHVVSWGKSM